MTQPDPVVPMLEMRSITKRFPGVVANDRVDLSVLPGRVHTLLGENGAGKSTLMKVLYGLYPQDEGTIHLDGEQVDIASPTDAIDRGIGMIHQHFMLVETLTVAENVALGLPSSRGALTDLDVVSEHIVELGSRYGLHLDPSAVVWQLAVGQKQRVEIIKALYRDAHLLILDEPTAVLTPQEVDQLFETLRQLTADGRGLIFISHKLHEVLALSDRQGCPTYLETFSAPNEQFYYSFGYRTVGKFFEPTIGADFLVMSRGVDGKTINLNRRGR